MKSKKNSKSRTKTQSWKEFCEGMESPALQETQPNSEISDLEDDAPPSSDPSLVKEIYDKDGLQSPKSDGISDIAASSKAVQDVAHNVFDKTPKQPTHHVFDKKTSQPPKTWSNLFSENRNSSKGMELEYLAPEDDDVIIDEGDRTPLHENWKHCLVGCFTGKFPGMQAVNAIKQGWGVKCTIMPHAKGWIIFKFECEDDRQCVITGGPYMVYGRTLMLKKLSEKFRFDDDEFLDVPIWVKFFGVPQDLWNKTGISKIASKLGKPLHSDQLTNERKRLTYARALVEVNLRKKPVTEYPIKARSGEVLYTQKIEYENFPSYCYFCKAFGHSFEQCKQVEKATDSHLETVCDVSSNLKNSATIHAIAKDSVKDGHEDIEQADCSNLKKFATVTENSAVPNVPDMKNRPKDVPETGKKATERTPPKASSSTRHAKRDSPTEIPVPVKNTFTVLSEGKSSEQERDQETPTGPNQLGNSGNKTFDEWSEQFDLSLWNYEEFKESILESERMVIEKMAEEKDNYTPEEMHEIAAEYRQEAIEAIEIFKRQFGS